jgi:hypothetical protein
MKKDAENLKKRPFNLHVLLKVAIL